MYNSGGTNSQNSRMNSLFGQVRLHPVYEALLQFKVVLMSGLVQRPRMEVKKVLRVVGEDSGGQGRSRLKINDVIYIVAFCIKFKLASVHVFHYLHNSAYVGRYYLEELFLISRFPFNSTPQSTKAPTT